jgi:general secretion pathway protein C
MLDVFLKKYAWTVKLALLFAAAWLLAKTVNTAVGAVIRPIPRIDLASLPAPAARTELPPQLDPERLYRLIGQKPPPPPETQAQEEEQAAPARACTDRRAPPMKSGLRAQLVAGVIAERPEWSIASIVDLSTRETRVYGIGEQVLGASLLSVERIRDERDATGAGVRVVAIVCNGGAKEYIDFEAGDAGGAAAPSIGVFPGRPTGPVGEGEGGPAGAIPPDGVRKLADNRYEIKRSVIDSTLSNLNNIATQARIVPSFKNGVANGFKLFSIQPGSLYSSIGVENGDVIQKINGYEINSPDKALEVYQKLKESRHISLEIERNGQVIRKEYNVAGP